MCVHYGVFKNGVQDRMRLLSRRPAVYGCEVSVLRGCEVSVLRGVVFLNEGLRSDAYAAGCVEVRYLKSCNGESFFDTFGKTPDASCAVPQ